MSGYGQGYQGGNEGRDHGYEEKHHSGERGLFSSGSSHSRPSGSSHGGGNAPLGGPSAAMFEEERHKADQMHKLKMAGGIAAGALAVGAAAVVGTKLYNDHQEEEKRHKQQEQQGHQYNQQYQQQGYQQPPPPQYQQQPGGGYLIPPCSGTKAGSGNYQPNPNRSSNNSVTPHAYPVIENNPGDNIVKFGTRLGLKHNMTGRLVTLEEQLRTNSGSNQLLACAGPWSYTASCAWQVMPANGDAPPPGTNVNYGTEIRLLHIPTGCYLHSHHGFRSPKTGQQEVTGYGGRSAGNHSDENDHWVVERAFQGSSGWNADEVFLLRHKVTGCTLHSHNEMIGNERQEVTAFGAASDENDKWRAVLH